MASATSFEPALGAFLTAGEAAIATAVLLLAWIAVLRAAGAVARARAARMTERWRPGFAAAIAGAPSTPMPAPSRREARHVLRLFVQLALALQGEGRTRLARHGRACGLHASARRLLRRRSTRDRLLAIETLGCIGAEEAVEDLRRACEDEHPILSLAAARALLRIDPRQAPFVVPLAVAREDWPAARLLHPLREAGAPVAEAIEEAIRVAAPDALPRALRLAAVLPPARTGPIVRAHLRGAADVEIVIACLKLLQDPRDAAFARDALTHGSWAVRVAAVRALGRVATEPDLPRLVDALCDPVWWVRQRAAEAIVQLPFLAAAELDRLRATLADRFGREALERALAERAFR